MNNITINASNLLFSPANAAYTNYLQVENTPNGSYYTLGTDMKAWLMVMSFIEIDDSF